MKRYRVTFLITMLAALVLQAATVKISHYGKKEGLPSNAVSDFIEDSRGYLWIGTWHGLCRYDGNEMINYTADAASYIPGFHQRVLQVLELKEDASIWMRMYNSKVYRINRVTDRVESVEKYWPEAATARFTRMITRGGLLWIVDDGRGILEIKPGNDGNAVHVSNFYSLPGLKVQSLTPVDNGSGLWVATDRGLMVYGSRYIKRRGMYLAGRFTGVTALDDSVLYQARADGNLVKVNTITGRYATLQIPEAGTVAAMGVDRERGLLYVATSAAGLWHLPLDGNGGPERIPGIGEEVTKMKIDAHGMVWLFDNNPGVLSYRPSDGRVKRFVQRVDRILSDPKERVVEQAGDVWVTMTGGGMGRYNARTDEIEYFYNEPGKTGSLSNVVTMMRAGDDSVVWQATARRGLDRIIVSAPAMTLRQLAPAAQERPDANYVKTFLRTRDALYISTRDGVLHRLAPGDTSRIITATDGRPIGNVYGMLTDRDGNMWLATRDNGLLKMCVAPDGTYTTTRFTHDKNDPYTIPDDHLQGLTLDSKGRLWIATFGGGVALMHPTNDGSIKFLSARNTMKSYPIRTADRLRSVCEGDSGQIWVGSTQGAVKLQYDDATGDVDATVYTYNPSDSESIGGDDIVCIYRDRKRRLWIGSTGGGLSRYLGNGKFQNFNSTTGFPENTIYGIADSNVGDGLWVVADDEVIGFDPDTHLARELIEELEGSVALSENSVIVMENGDVMVGSDNGYFTIDHKFLQANRHADLKVVITKVLVDGKDVSPRVNSDYKTSAAETGIISVPSGSTRITVEVSSLNWALRSRVGYRYRLDDGDWTPCGSSHSITVDNLSPGTHKLVIEGTFPGAPASQVTLEIHVHVKATVLVTLVVVLLAAVGGFLLVKYRRNLRRQASGGRNVPGLHLPIVPVDTAQLAHLEPREESDREFVDNLLKWMEDNYADTDMKIDDMVNASGLGRTTFYTRLKTIADLSPMEFVIDFRMKKACALLIDTDKNIAEIAILTGYVDPRYFTRAFKSRFGVTPTSYRRAIKN